MRLHPKPRRYRLISSLGSPTARAIYMAALGLTFAGRKEWVRLRFLIAAVYGASAFNSLAKELIARRRPHRAPRVATAGGYSFPSGHSTGSTALALAIVALLRESSRRHLAAPAAALGLLYAVFVGRSRVVLSEHHRGDVFAGWTLGLLWVVMVSRIFNRRHTRHSS
jgi:undecaprenyl-diphosphatase